MSPITDEAVAAKARELHDTGCGCPRGISSGIGWLTAARHELEQEALDADAESRTAARAESGVHHEHPAAVADERRVRAELADRLERVLVHDAGDIERALRQLAHDDPDAVNAALDEIGAPL